MQGNLEVIFIPVLIDIQYNNLLNEMYNYMYMTVLQCYIKQCNV